MDYQDDRFNQPRREDREPITGTEIVFLGMLVVFFFSIIWITVIFLG